MVLHGFTAQDDPDNLILQACSLLLEAADQRQLRQNGPWSICEIGLDDRDYDWLKSWAGGLSLRTTQLWLRSSPRQSLLNGEYSRPQSVFGLILIAFIAEHARRFGSEGELWPCVSNAGFIRNHDILFNPTNNQPTADLKECLERTARDFGLRHVFGIEGMMNWFNTIYLQIGLTERGMQRRLPNWLAGQCPSLAARLLCDDESLKSNSFADLWNQLLWFRKNLITAERLRQTLLASTWVRNEFIETILHAAKQRIALGTGSFLGTGCEPLLTESKSALDTALSEAIFVWLPGQMPHFKFEIGTITCTRDDVSAIKIGTERLIPVHAQAHETFLAAPGGEVYVGMEQPLIIAQLIAADGEPIETVERKLYPMDQEVVVFTDHGTLLPDPWHNIMHTNRSYTLLLAPDLHASIEAPAKYNFGDSVSGVLWRLPAGWKSDVTITLEGVPLWQPITSYSPIKRPLEPNGIALFLPSNNIEYEKDFSLRLAHPVGSTVEFARANGRPVEPHNVRPGLTEIGPCIVTPAQEPAHINAVIGIDIDGAIHIVRHMIDIPRVEGAAILDPAVGWKAAGDNLTLTVSTAKSAPVRLNAPSEWNTDQSRWALIEGEIWSNDAPRRGASLGQLGGYGGALQLYPRPFNVVEDPVLIASEVSDPGVVESVEIDLKGSTALLRIALSHNIEPSDDYRAIVWWRISEIHTCAIQQAEVSTSGLCTWIITCDTPIGDAVLEPVAVGVGYRGQCIGSWWSNNWSNHLNRCNHAAAGVAATMIHWLKLPLINSRSIDNIRDFADTHLPEVTASWLEKTKPPAPLVLSGCSDTWLPAISTCFENCVPTTNQVQRLLELFSQETPFDTFLELVLGLCRINVFLTARVVQKLVDNQSIRREDVCILAGKVIEAVDIGDAMGALPPHIKIERTIVRISEEMRPQRDTNFVARLVALTVRIYCNQVVQPFEGRNIRIMLNSLDSFRKVVAANLFYEIAG